MNYFKKVPEEVLEVIFTYFDQETKLVASKVSGEWRNLIHYRSWKSISRLVEGSNTMKKEFSTFGWIEEDEHEILECRCIELHLGHHPLANATLSQTNQNTIFYDNFKKQYNKRAVVFGQSKLIGVKTRREEDIVTFYEIDFEDTSLSWNKVQQKWVEDDSVEEDNDEDDDVKGEDDDVKGDDDDVEGADDDVEGADDEVEEYGWEEYDVTDDSEDEYYFEEGDESTSLICCDKTLVLMEKFYWTSAKVHLTLWNTETWAFVCELPLEKTSIEILKQKYEVSEKNIKLSDCYSIELSSDILVVAVDVEGIDDVKSMAVFWKLDTSNPAAPTFLTYILEEKDVVGYMHLNEKYFCKRKWHDLQVYALDDIKKNHTSKSWEFPASESGSVGFDTKLEGGKSNRLAVISSENKFNASVFKIIDIGNGECMFSLKFEKLSHHFSEVLWNLSKDPIFKFHLGKLLLIQPLKRLPTSKYRYQIIIIDEMAKNQVMLGATFEVDSIFSLFLEDSIYIGAKSMVGLTHRGRGTLTHWKVEKSIA